ncbi:MAG: response regulator [Bdellovibrionaceae bacterium]|nr:response regulator [Pseudobdellovibrionaceae bacterium]NUM59904.1 response regulator [Pseudobdellovibrionaceae bacterium]
MKKKILIVEDDTNLANTLAKDFLSHNYDVDSINSSAKYNDNFKYDYAIIDIRLKQGELGLNFIDRLLKTSPSCRVVILTGYGSVVTAVEAIKKGAVNYLMKPSSFSQIEAALLGTISEKLTSEDFSVPTLSQIEHDHIDFVLTQNNGNISKTAKDLGLHRQSLQRKLKKYT